MSTTEPTPMAGLHKGEAAAIELAVVLAAELLLMDDRRGVLAAERKGNQFTGTLGVLDIAAERGLIDFAEAIGKFDKAAFRKPRLVLQVLLEKHATRSES